jgi:hypothetical protein
MKPFTAGLLVIVAMALSLALLSPDREARWPLTGVSPTARLDPLGEINYPVRWYPD